MSANCQAAQRRSSFRRSQGGSPIRSHLALAAIAALALSSAGSAQTGATQGKKTQAQYAGGFNPRYCIYPKAARAAQQSACCQMDLEIDADGHVLKSHGECTDPVFLEPTQRCLAAQAFIPATQDGRPVRALQHLEYEWRATGSAGLNLCNKLKTS